MTRTHVPEKKRYSAIVRELSDLSRNGWANAKYDDYAPLEIELAAIAAKRQRKTEGRTS